MRTTTEGLPDADVLACASSELLESMTSGDLSATMTPELLLRLPSSALYHQLPLLLSALQAFGELCGEDRESFIDTLAAFRSRLCSSAPLLTRFLTHVAHPSYATYWVVDTIEADDAGEDGSGFPTRDGALSTRGIHINDGGENQPEEVVQDDGDDENVAEETGGEQDISDSQDEPLVEEDEAFVRTRRAITAARSSRAVRQVVLTLPVDNASEYSRTFWTEIVHGAGSDGADEVQEEHQFQVEENGGVYNPFLAPVVDESKDDEADGDNQVFGDQSPGDNVGNVVIVRKVFSSIARPFLVTVHPSSEDAPIGPSVLVKAGDDLTQDMAVSLLFQALNCIWASDSELSGAISEDLRPIAGWYDVAPTAVTRGIMRGVAGLKSLSEHDWKEWTERAGDDRETACAMARSAAGGYVATYIVGGRDRHFDNIVIHDKLHLVHIDFTYIMGKKPPLDAPPIAIASEMEDAFRAVGIWDEFLESCAAAYASARRNCRQVLSAAALAFARTGVSVKEVSKFVRGRRSLDLGQEDVVALEAFMKQVRESAHSAQTWVKRLAHQYVDPAWYSLIRSGFPPATAIIAYMDNIENKQAQKLADQLKLAADRITDEDRVKLEGDAEDA